MRTMELRDNTFLLKVIELRSWVELQSLFYWTPLYSLFFPPPSLFVLPTDWNFYLLSSPVERLLSYVDHSLNHPWSPFFFRSLSYPLRPSLLHLSSVPLQWVCIHGQGQSWAEGTLDALDQDVLPELMSGSWAFRKKLSWSVSQECTELDPDARPWVNACFQSRQGDPELHVTDAVIC